MAVYTVLAPNSLPISNQARIRRMALMAVTTAETLSGMPIIMNRFEMTMDKPEMDPSTSLLGIMK